MISSVDQFKRLLPGYPIPKDREMNSEFGIIKKGDSIRIRAVQEGPNFKK